MLFRSHFLNIIFFKYVSPFGCSSFSFGGAGEFTNVVPQVLHPSRHRESQEADAHRKQSSNFARSNGQWPTPTIAIEPILIECDSDCNANFKEYILKKHLLVKIGILYLKSTKKHGVLIF